MRATPARTTGWSSTIRTRITASREPITGGGGDREAGLEPPPVGGRPGIEAAARARGPARPCRRGRSAAPADPARRPGGHGRRRADGHRRRRSRRAARRGCRERAGPRWPGPLAPHGGRRHRPARSRSAADSATDDVDDESGPAILVDERQRRRPTPGQRRVGASLVGRSEATVARIWSRLARPTVSASSSARSASSRSRRSTCRAPVTCSSIAASVCPARSCSSRAMRRRSSATSWSASARRACSSCSISRCWRYTAVPSDQGEQVGESPTAPTRSPTPARSASATSHGSAAAAPR